jgi:hypothetical protein
LIIEAKIKAAIANEAKGPAAKLVVAKVPAMPPKSIPLIGSKF